MNSCLFILPLASLLCWERISLTNFLSFMAYFASATVIASMLSDIDSSSILFSISWLFQAIIRRVRDFWALAVFRVSACCLFYSSIAAFFSFNVKGFPVALLISFCGMAGCCIMARTSTAGLTRWSGMTRFKNVFYFRRTELLIMSKLLDLTSSCGLIFFGEGLITAFGTCENFGITRNDS